MADSDSKAEITCCEAAVKKWADIKNSQQIIGLRLRQHGSPITTCRRRPQRGQYSNWPDEAVSSQPKTDISLRPSGIGK